MDHLRDLLGLLCEFKVAAFTAGGLAVTFQHDDSEPVPDLGRSATEIVEDESRSASSRRVRGFNDEPVSTWKHPSLWGAQGGKTLSFDGSLK